jgi:hypothetical protein
VQQTAPNAYAVMLRRALEAICRDRGVAKSTLHDSLEELSKRGEIPPILAEMTTVLRQLGNDGAHAASRKVTVPLTWVMDEFFRAVIEYVYVAPGKLANFKARLDGKHPPINTTQNH